EADRERFGQGLSTALDSPELATRVKSLESISYIALGVWGYTAGAEKDDLKYEFTLPVEKWLDSHNAKFGWQLRWIVDGTKLISSLGVIQKLVTTLKNFWDSEQDSDTVHDSSLEATNMSILQQIEINQTLTVLYLIIEVSRWQQLSESFASIKKAVATVKPGLLSLLTQIIAKLRWEDSSEPSLIPRPRILLLFWKTFSLLLGNAHDVNADKRTLRADSEGDLNQDQDKLNFITASPLDYHLFRQEITSKYPAYSPPQPLVPIEPENNSILPPLPNHSSRQASQENLGILTNSNIVGGSIFNQPVHIATPAPSPPPSPAGPGGKGGKKQNYQTNQNFPFLYPPLDNTSNTLGGKGSFKLQDRPRGKRWEGADVPASILEAGELFADRMRMSRSLRQLWDVREKYIRHERGWNESNEHDIDKDTVEDREESGGDDLDADFRDYISSEKDAKMKDEPPNTLPEHFGEIGDKTVQSRLGLIDQYYRDVLPDLQSLIIVLWKELFQNVSALVASSSHNGLPNAIEEGTNDGASKRKTNPNSSASLNDVLKYEYLTQLLLDANYLPLILKFFAHQDVDKAVEQKNDRDDLG
ncbi:MAG: hypothetical protein Q9164_007236, partial [Protoblastenia rupestris]